MKKLLFCSLVLLLLLSSVVQADEFEEISKQIAELERARQMSIEATRPLEKIVADLKKQTDNIQARIDKEAREIKNLEKNIFEREVDLAYQYEILKRKVRDYYKRSRLSSPLLIFLSSDTASQLTRELAFRQATVNEDRRIIVTISKNILELEKDKEKLEEDKIRLASLQKKLDKQKEFFEGEIKGAKEYQEDLSGKIAELISRQKALLAEKTGTFQTSVGEVPLADDPNARPDYDPGFRPAFAAFSFGAPHFKGMSQYGAFGRAKNGQSAEDILRAYYGGGIEIKKDFDKNFTINVEGYGAVDLETYAKRIYEMPGSWGDDDAGGMEALKAQAVAARSYAVARMQSTGSICSTESCQVYKPINKGGNWETGVNATPGWVIFANGKPLSAWYASTSGGYQESYNALGYLKDGSSYNTPGFWDAEGGRGGWTGQAWEMRGGSPWFYKGWYKSRSGKSCGRSHPWLTSEEMADMVNAAVVYQNNKDNDEVKSHIWQEDNCYPSGADIWSKTKMREEAAKYDTEVSSVVNDFSITYSTGGITSKVVFQTDKGSVEIEGLSFYKAFNRRAPGAIHLKSGLFNIEKK